MIIIKSIKYFFVLFIVASLFAANGWAISQGEYLNTSQPGLTLSLSGGYYYLYTDSQEGYQEFEYGTYQEQAQNLLFYPDWNISGQQQNSTAVIVDECTISWGQSGDFVLSDCTPSDDQNPSQTDVCGGKAYPSFSGVDLCIPTIAIGQALYQTNFELLTFSPPYILQLTSLSSATSAGNAYSAYLGTDGFLYFPLLEISGSFFSAVMSIASVEPQITFAIEAIYEAEAPDQSEDSNDTTDNDTSQNNGTTGNLILNYRVLVEYFEYLTAEQVAGIFQRLDETQLLNLGIYNPFGDLVHYYACQADPTLLFSGGTGTYTNCAQQAASWAQTAQYTSNPTEYAFSQRDALLISIKCATGEIDSGSCAAYLGLMSEYGAMSNDTSMTIINNIGGNCYLGEPGCVP